MSTPSAHLEAAAPVRAIAFYLPQFHPLPENSCYRGESFTEWTDVARAKPNFRGHYQPHLPADLGYYDLRLPEVRLAQVELARRYGVHGFCYYWYWFAGKKLLERPVSEMLASGKPDFPFCICWANENWTRRDGADQEIPIAQNPSRENDLHLVHDLIPFFRDERYVRIDGKPLFMVYRVGVLPDAAASAEIWREACRREGVGDIYLCAAKTYDTEDPIRFGFDAVVELPPHGMRTLPRRDGLDLHNPDFTGTIVDYRRYVLECLRAPLPAYACFRTVMPGWDNTARHKDNALTFVNATPEVYEYWLREIVAQTVRLCPPSERLVFINAWNEWAEGAHLEPDQRFGHQFLRATLRALTAPVAAASGSTEVQGTTEALP